MSSIDHVGRGEFEELKREIRALQTQSPLESSSVTGGRVRFIGGVLRIDSGGRVEIDGTFVGAGGMTWTGTVAFQSTFTQNGPWNLNGPGTIAGDVNQTGNTTQQGDVNLTGGGRITAGSITIDPSSNGGSVKFTGGPEIFASGATLSLYSGATNGAYIELAPGVAQVSGGGARWIEVTPTGFRFVGVPAKNGTGLTPGLPWLDTDGTLYRIAS